MASSSRAGGKGSAKRPTDVSTETFDSNFERIFGKKKTAANSQPVTIRLEGTLLEELRAVAYLKNCTTENLVEAALIQFIAEQKQIQKEMSE